MLARRVLVLRVALLVLALAGSAPASAQSAFSHRVPIQVPRGANGMQPDLALVYDPVNGNGAIGMGWTLTGLSAITRVNYGNGINYAGADTYSDSTFGVLVKQSVDGSYRSKRESFVRFVPIGTFGDGPSAWEVSYPTGIKYTYGGNDGARLRNSAGTAYRTWALSSVTDQFGNSYEVTYDAGDAGQLYPSLITYTKAADLGTYRTVGFTYEARSDVQTQYFQRAVQQTARRLKTITIRSGVTANNRDGTLVRRYVLGYDPGARRSHLTSVQELGSDGTTALPAQQFGWGTGAFADVVTSVANNGLGGSITVSYQPATQVPGAIVPGSGGPGIPNTAPTPLVTRVQMNDGRGQVRSTAYGYSDRRFLPGAMPDRRDLGFASITQTDEQTGEVVRTTYNQTPQLEHTVASVARWAATSAGLALVDVKRFAYEVVTPSAGTELARVTVETDQTYELGALGYTVTTAYTYDSYSNPATKTVSGDGVPSIVTTMGYQNDANAWIIGRAVDVTVSSGSTILRRTHDGWTGNQLTSRAAWLDTAGKWLTTSMRYDTYGTLVGVTEPATADGTNRSTAIAFETTYRANPETVTDALGHTTRYAYWPDGQVQSVTGPNGETTFIDYDVHGRKWRERRPDGGATTTTYQGLGNAGAQYVQSTATVGAGQPSLTRTAWFDGTGFVYHEERTGPLGSVVATGRTKDAAGRLQSEAQPYTPGASSVPVTSYSYDTSGRLERITTADGKVTRYAYDNVQMRRSRTDANGNATTQYFDAFGRITAVVDAAAARVSYEYDPLGKLTKVTTPSGTTTLGYDSLGRKTAQSSPELGTTLFSYDEVGNLTGTLANGKAVGFQYDAVNRVLLKQPQGEPPVTYTYDQPEFAYGIGRLTSVSDAGGIVTYAYTPMGKPAATRRQMDGGSFTVSYTYDQVGRVTGLQYPNRSYQAVYTWKGASLSDVTLNGALIARWGSYDPSGRPLSVTYGNGVATTYQYDSVGHPMRVAAQGATGAIQDLSFDWYSAPSTGGLNLGSVIDNRSNKIIDGVNTDASRSFSYDALNRLTQATGVWGTKRYGYDAAGNVTTFGGSVDRTLEYSGNRLTSGTGLGPVRYDDSGNIAHKSLDGIDWDYTWTVENRLATVTQNGRLVATMTYDASGERLKKVATAAGSATTTTIYIGDLYEKRAFADGSPERHTVNVYGNGQLVASVTVEGAVVTAMNGPNAWRIDAAAGSMYDARTLRGAALKSGSVASMLLSHPATGQGIIVLAFGAFAIWILVSARRGLRGSWDRRLCEPGLRLGAAGVVLVFTGAACSPMGGPAAIARNAAVAGRTSGPGVGAFYYHRDQVGSATVVTDASGAVVERLSYMPFGEISQGSSWSASGDAITRKFTGKEHDPEADLTYYGSRYYDPHIGRFLSPDTVVPNLFDLQAINRYAYVMNNPIVRVDPSGHEPVSITATVTMPLGPVGQAVAVGVVAAIVTYPSWEPVVEKWWNKIDWKTEWNSVRPVTEAVKNSVANVVKAPFEALRRLIDGIHLGRRHDSPAPTTNPYGGGGMGGNAPSTAMPSAPPNGSVGQPSSPPSPGGGGSGLGGASGGSPATPSNGGGGGGSHPSPHRAEYVTLNLGGSKGMFGPVYGEIGDVFALDPATSDVHAYRYWGVGVGLGFGWNIGVQVGAVTMDSPYDLAGNGLAVSAFAAAGPNGAAVGVFGNGPEVMGGNGTAGFQVGGAAGAGVGVGGGYERTTYIGKYKLSDLPADVRRLFEGAGRAKR